MSDNTVQYDWIVRLVSNLKHLLREQVAFVAGDLQWYPVQVEYGETPPSQAPDAMVALGRPQGHRGSYKQWEEDNLSPQVVFEIISPSNTHKEMAQKQDFYAKYGVLEMYYYDPQRKDFWGFVRNTPEESCRIITPLTDLPWVSPLLQIRFELLAEGLQVFYPDGTAFKAPEAFALEEEQARAERDRAWLERDQEKLARQQAQEQLEQMQTKQEKLLAKLRELGIEPESL